MVQEPQKEEDKELLMERVIQGNAEARHWANTVLRILVGFMTLFGVFSTILFTVVGSE